MLPVLRGTTYATCCAICPLYCAVKEPLHLYVCRALRAAASLQHFLYLPDSLSTAPLVYCDARVWMFTCRDQWCSHSRCHHELITICSYLSLPCHSYLLSVPHSLHAFPRVFSLPLDLLLPSWAPMIRSHREANSSLRILPLFSFLQLTH